MNVSVSYHSQMATQLASLTVLPLWYPLFAKSLYQRSQIIESKAPGDLSHSTFFNNKRNYYRGLSINLAMQPLFPLSDWVLNHLLKKIEQANQRDPNVAERMGAGFIAGASTVLFSNPCEVTLIASQKYQENAYKAFKRVWKNSGARGFYTGSVPTAIGNGTYLSCLFVTTPFLQKQIHKQIPGSGKVHDMATMVLAATMPACAYISISVPIDLMSIMRQSDPERKIYTSAFQTIRAAYQKHGKAAFKAGLKNRLAASMIEMTGFNLLRNFYLEKLQ